MPKKKEHSKGDEYEVGYGRPPTHSQFKPGQSGNPKGRPKGSKNTKTILAEELDTKITLTEGSQKITITKREAMVKSSVNKAIKGDHRAFNLLYKEANFLDEVEEAKEEQRKASSITNMNLIEDFILSNKDWAWSLLKSNS